jgi:hypothetical protein
MSTSTQVIYFERDMVILMETQRREFPDPAAVDRMMRTTVHTEARRRRSISRRVRLAPTISAIMPAPWRNSR